MPKPEKCLSKPQTPTRPLHALLERRAGSGSTSRRLIRLGSGQDLIGNTPASFRATACKTPSLYRAIVYNTPHPSRAIAGETTPQHFQEFQRFGNPCRLTVCVTCVWAGVDNAWEQKKLEARKMLLNRADSHTSGARFVGRCVPIRKLIY